MGCIFLGTRRGWMRFHTSTPNMFVLVFFRVKCGVGVAVDTVTMALHLS